RAKAMLELSLRKFNETLDDRPYIMDLVRNYNAHIENEFTSVAQAKINNNLSTPLKAFFGNMDTTLLSRKRKFDIVLLDDMMNIDQLRVIHNALKQPITYVQGPPGTGKTQSILNLLISAFFNDQTVLVSSNNNKPIDDIYAKLRSLESRNRPLPMPILRLGNNEKVKESIQLIKDYLKRYDKLESDDLKLARHRVSNTNNMQDINLIIDNYERRLELEEEIDALKSMLTNISLEFRSNIIINTDLSQKQKELDLIEIIKDEEIHNHVVKADDSFFTWLFFTSVKYIKRPNEPKYQQFNDILNHDNEDEQIKLFNNYLMDNDNFKQLQRVFPIIMTTNQSAYRLGAPTPNFDLVVIDEAGQCSIGASLFPIIRGKRLLLVGDQNQLRPVITLSPETNKKLMKKYRASKSYNYVESSIIRLMQNVDSISKFILLRYHYRCHKDIIDFSNRKYYNKKLIIPSKTGFDKQALFFLPVNQKNAARSNEKNTAIAEVEAIIQDIKEKPGQSIGIITPFRNQADLLRERIKQENLTNVDVGTVHTFQGDEKDTIYMSSAITSRSSNRTFDWVKNNQELINVATTRAKKEFIMVGDFKELKNRSNETNDYFELAEYVLKNGKEVELTAVQGDNYVNSSNYRQYNT
ncbi:MAG: DNA helicase, partial [Tenericutes bacterium HGW-Tenericutes-8]